MYWRPSGHGTQGSWGLLFVGVVPLVGVGPEGPLSALGVATSVGLLGVPGGDCQLGIAGDDGGSDGGGLEVGDAEDGGVAEPHLHHPTPPVAEPGRGGGSGEDGGLGVGGSEGGGVTGRGGLEGSGEDGGLGVGDTEGGGVIVVSRGAVVSTVV